MLDLFTKREYFGTMLTTVDAVIETLGGTSAVADLAGVRLSAVSNWKARGRIPSEKFLKLSTALLAKGVQAAPELFGFEAAGSHA